MRKTEDGFMVDKSEFVYEIIFRYYNEEASIPEPDNRQVMNIPEGVKIWKERPSCQTACNKIIDQQQNPSKYE